MPPDQLPHHDLVGAVGEIRDTVREVRSEQTRMSVEISALRADVSEVRVAMHGAVTGDPPGLTARVRANEGRLDKLEDSLTWAWRLVVGSVLTGIAAAVLAALGMAGG